MFKSLKVSIIIPCLNEEKAIGRCVDKSIKYGEVIVVDNGSVDKSVEIAKKAGARVIVESRKGYGRALLTGLEQAKGDFLVFADGDGSYDFSESPKLLEKLKNFDLVIGSRLKGKIQKNAMPFMHQYLGTPVLNYLFNLFFKVKTTDVNSGFRALTKIAFNRLKLKSYGMEFASEMLYKASREGLRVGEVSITYRKRIGISKLSPFRDAWRHIKFLLLFSPSWLFMLPGSLLGILGVLGLLMLPQSRIHSLTLSSFLTLLGFQIVFLGLFAKVFAVNFLEIKDEKTVGLMEKFNLEKGVIAGAVIGLIGLIGLISLIWIWWKSGFGALSEEKLLIISITLLMLGLQIVFSSFFFGLLGREER